jgi:hypothetical protein
MGGDLKGARAGESGDLWNSNVRYLWAPPCSRVQPDIRKKNCLWVSQSASGGRG